MSIKSKGKTKQRPVSRGPRREPVPVPKPFVRRRWVQLTAIFIVGAFAMTVFVWATNGLRRDRASNQAAQELSTRQKALSQWKTVVESQFSALGQLQGAVPPIIASDISAAVQALDKGQDPAAKAKDLESSANELAGAAKTIDDFDLPTTIADQGFDAAGSTALTSSKEELVQALRLYEQAAKLAATARSSEGETRTQLAASAKALEESASSLLQSGWIKYSSVLTQNQLSAGGTPSGLGSGLTGGAG
jgi:hypothetical protein